MVAPMRFERTTCSLGGSCSIQLSYGTHGTYSLFSLPVVPMSWRPVALVPALPHGGEGP